MGFFKKIFKGIGKVFKKIGKGIKKVFKKIGKAFGKLGFVGTIALAFLAPYALPAIAGWAGGLAASGNAFVAGFGKMVGAATKVIGGVGKAIGIVTKAVTSTVSNIAGKVGGEFLKKLGIENFMGKDLTKLDSWGEIWGKTQESFAGIKGSFKEGFKEVGSIFDKSMAETVAKDRSLLDVSDISEIPSSTADAIREGAYTSPGEVGQGAYSPIEDPFTMKDPLTGEIVAKPAMTPIEQVNPITGDSFYSPAANPTMMVDGKQSLLLPDYGTTPAGIDPVTGGTSSTVAGEIKTQTIPKKSLVSTKEGSFGGMFVDELKSQGARGLATAALTPLLGGGDTGGGYVGGGMGIVSAGQVQVAPGSEVQVAYAPIENPQSDWAMAFARDNTAFDPFSIVGRQQAPQMVG